MHCFSKWLEVKLISWLKLSYFFILLIAQVSNSFSEGFEAARLSRVGRTEHVHSIQKLKKMTFSRRSSIRNINKLFRYDSNTMNNQSSFGKSIQLVIEMENGVFFLELNHHEGIVDSSLDLDDVLENSGIPRSPSKKRIHATAYRGSVYTKNQVIKMESNQDSHIQGSWVIVDSKNIEPVGKACLTLWEDSSLLNQSNPVYGSGPSSETVFTNTLCEGHFNVFDTNYHIKPQKTYALYDNHFRLKHSNGLGVSAINDQGKHIIYTQSREEITSRILPTLKECGNSENSEVMFNKTILRKRDSSGCPASMMVAYVGIAMDCTYIQFYQGADNAIQKVISNLNMASSVYESQFNIKLVLRRMVLNPVCNQTASGWNSPCSDYYSITQRLSDFSEWNNQQSPDNIALWHLMTMCSSSSTLGIAWFGQVCSVASPSISNAASGMVVSNTAVSSVATDEWKVFAHEVGHGFGAKHDCSTATCPCESPCTSCCLCSNGCNCGDQYLMSPTSQTSATDFSPCAVNDICNFFGTYHPSCLMDPSTKLNPSGQPINIEGNLNPSVFYPGTPVCGNGVVEAGEQCDCGGPLSCLQDMCCNSNCTLKSGAVCSDSNSVCCDNCKYAKGGTLCRPSRNPQCDYAEYCNGTSSACPDDQIVTNGQTCGLAADNTVCISGYCTNRAQQCRDRGINVTGNSFDCGAMGNQCNLVCPNPSNSKQCTVLRGFVLEGTPCQNGGFCQQGICLGSNQVLDMLSFINGNPNYGIAITASVLSVVIALVIAGICCAKHRKRKRKRAAGGAPPETKKAKD